MYIVLRDELADSLKKAGYRVISPFKVPIGWIDIAIFRKRFAAIDFYAGCYESCVERLTSYPFRETYVIGNCDFCTEIDKFCNDFDVSIPKTTEGVLENPSAHVKAIEDSLAYLYIVGEIYEEKIQYRPLRLTYPELKMLGLATSSSKPKLKPEMFMCLTHDGHRAAKKVIARRTVLMEKKLRKIADDSLNCILALGISESLSVRKLFEMPEDYSLKSILGFMKNFPLEEVSIDISNTHPKTMLCNFLVNSVFNHEAVKLARKLSEIGLAFKFKLYSPYGYEMGEEYRVAREAVEAILKFNYVHIPRDVIGEFLAAVYPIHNSDIYPILNYAGEFLRKAERDGFCRLNRSKIVIGEKFIEYAKVRLATIVEKIVEGLF